MTEFTFKLDLWAILVSAEASWLLDSDGLVSFIWKDDIDSVNNFLLNCSLFEENFLSLWNQSKLKIVASNQTNGIQKCQLIDSLYGHQKVLLLLGDLPLPFDSVTNAFINRPMVAAIYKIKELSRERVRELEAPWLAKKITGVVTALMFYAIARI